MQHSHSPCEYLADVGREYILSHLNDAELDTVPPDHIRDDDPHAYTRWEAIRLLYHLRGPKPEKKARRKRSEPNPAKQESVVRIAGVAMVLGMQVTPLARFSKGEYGYHDDGEWWTFRVVEREGYHKMYTMSERK